MPRCPGAIGVVAIPWRPAHARRSAAVDVATKRGWALSPWRPDGKDRDRAPPWQVANVADPRCPLDLFGRPQARVGLDSRPPGRRAGRNGSRPAGARCAAMMLHFAVACLVSGAMAAPTGAAAEAEFLTVPTETFRAAAADAVSEAAAEPRAPLPPSLMYRLPPPPRTELSRIGDAADAGDEEGPTPPVQQVGIGRDVVQLAGGALDNPALLWQPTADGGQAAALGVASGEAKALRVRLVIEGAPPGLEVRVYDAAGTAATVAAVPAHQLPGAEGGSAVLWTPTVPGDATTVELYLPPGTEPGELKVSIPVLSHLVAHPTPLIIIGTPELCRQHTDVACAADEISDATRRAVAKYVYTTGRGYTSECTGTLLNDADRETQIPYFLTARHCLDNQQKASSMELSWFYERASCGGPDPEGVIRQTGGATVLAAAGYSPPTTGVDHVLVRLNSEPPDGVAMAGWTTAGTAPGDTAVGVHHPLGALKKLARQSLGGFTGWKQAGSSHIVTRPDINLQPGSSGSGLWKRIAGADYLVGVATGVSNKFACEGDLTNYYGRFDRFYPKVSGWLGAAANAVDSERFIVTHLALVDAATRVEVADLTAGDAVVDLAGTTSRSFDIVAELNGEPGRVEVTLSGPRAASHASDLPPYTLFGPGGGGGLVAGSYRVKVAAHGPDPSDGTLTVETEVPFEVTGSAGDDRAVTGLALAVGDGPRILELADGTAVTVYAGEPVEVRARTSGGGAVASVAFALSGAGTLAATTNEAPFAVPATLTTGTYRIAATPHAAADGGGDAGTALAVTGVTVMVVDAPVTGFTLVDASGGLPDPDIGPLADEDTVDLSAYDGWASVRADLAAAAADSRVVLALDGPREAARTVTGGVVSLFGESGGDYVAGAFPDGAYTLTAKPYAGPEPRDVLPAATVAFTVTGGFAGAVAGFTLIDARDGAPDPDFAAITDGATLNLRDMADRRVDVRVDLGWPEAAGSVRLALRGPVAATVTDSEAPYLLFGGAGDDVQGGKLPDGEYTLTARPFSGPDETGDVLPTKTVTFAIADSGWPQTRVSGFTLIDAAGGPPDPAIGTIGQDASIHWPGGGTGEYSIRADLTNLDGIGSVRLKLSGPVHAAQVDNNDGSPFTLFGDDRDSGDIQGRGIPRGRYYIEAMPFSGQDGDGEDGVPQTAFFTLAAPALDVALVTGFTLVDAGATPAADVGGIAAGATLDASALTEGAGDIRADIAFYGTDARSVVFELRGPRDVTRTDSRRPFSLFGDGAGGYAGNALPNGAYTLTATPYTETGGRGNAFRETTVAFTVTGSFEAGAPAVTGFAMFDTGDAGLDLGTLADGGTLDLSSATTGMVDIRGDKATGRADAKSVVFELRGPRNTDKTVNAGAPWRLFGPGGGVLPNGTYTLTATPYTEVGGRGDALTATAVTFTVTGSFDVGDAPVTGFTLVDARGGLPDPDLGPLADGAEVDLSGTDGLASVRADLAPRRGDVSEVVLTLEGPRPAHRTAPARAPVSLFGDTGGDYVAGAFVDGDYTLTAHPLGKGDLRVYSFDDGAGRWTRGGQFRAIDGVFRSMGGPGAHDHAYIADFKASDLVLEADVHAPPSGHRAGVLFGGSDSHRYIGVVHPGVREALIGRINLFPSGGFRIDVLARTYLRAAGPWYRVKVVTEGSRIELHIDGAPVLTVEDPRYAGGHAGLWSFFAGTAWDNVMAWRRDDPDGLRPETAVTFTVTGAFAHDARVVKGFTLVDAADGVTEPDVATIADGATVDLSSTTTGVVDIRADASGFPGAQSIVLALRGPRNIDRTVDAETPWRIFGVGGGALPNGTYTLTATPYTEAAGRGDALAATTLTFTVTGSFDLGAAPVTGFTLVDARGGLPDPDLGALADGAEVDLSDTDGLASVRAELAPRRPQVAGVVLALEGPRPARRIAPARAPVSLFGDSGGDYVAGPFIDGDYTLTARPVKVLRTDSFDDGAAGWSPRTYGQPWVSDGVYWVDEAGARKVVLTGFEAGDLVLEADVRIERRRHMDAGVLFRARDVKPGRYFFRGYYAGVHYRDGQGPFLLLAKADWGTWGSRLWRLGEARLTAQKPWYRLGVVAVGSRIEAFVDGRPMLQIEDSTYRSGGVGLRAAYAPAGWDNIAVAGLEDPEGLRPETAVAFTVTGAFADEEALSNAPVVKGFTLVDAADGVAEPDVATIANGATVDLSSTTTGAVDIRADASGLPGAQSMVLALRGPRSIDRTVDAETPWRIFGVGGGALPNGTYTLTATPYTEAVGGGDALPVTTVTFTVTGSFEPGAAPVTGFTLVDARDGLPDPDLGALADGAEVDLSGTGGLASVRAELAPRRPDVAGIVLALRGARSADRIAPARAPVSLFGDSGGDYEAGALPGGAYTLTARPVGGLRADGFDEGAPSWTVYDGAWAAVNGIYSVAAGTRDGEAVLGGFEAADLVLETDMRVAPGQTGAGVLFRASDFRSGENGVRGYYAGLDESMSVAVLGRIDDGRWHTLGTADIDGAGPWARLKVAASGSRIRMFVDGALLLEVEDTTYARGAVGLRSWNAAAEWDDFVVAGLDDPDGLLPETAIAFTVAGLPALSIAAGAAATEGGAAVFTITADPAPAADLVVAVSVTQGTADDYLRDTLPTAVTIAAGVTETTLSVALPDDTVDEADGIIVATIGASPDYEVTTSSASLAVHDNDVPALSIAAGAAVTEGGTATFTITADPAPAADLEVAVSVTQGADDDYLPDTLPTAVTIAAGATETTLSLALPDDTVDEPDGIIVATIGTSPDYEVTTSSASLAVHDNDNDVPALSIAAGEAVTEGDTATFTITVDPAPAATLAVAVSVTQGANDDYLPDNLTTALWIPPGATTAVVVVAFPDDELDEPDGVVTVTIGESSDYDVTTSSASLTVHDNDLPTLSIAAGETATEGGTATFTITAEQALSADLAVPVAVTEEGSPVGGLRRASTVRLARGALQATLTVPLPDDEVVEPDGAIVATILEGPDNVGGLEYHIAVASARVVVLDDDVPALSITGGAAVTEGGTATFTVTADQAPVADLVVDVSVTQGAQDDYLPDTPPTSVTIAAGATDATLSVPLPDDQLDEPDGEVTATVAASPKYDVTVASARVTVHDDDVPLTAEFVDMPESHDGRTPFAFELRFSEDFPGQLPFTLLRDEAFRVEHGRVRRAGRVEEGQNQRWTIEVRPESHEAVTIELPAATDCSAAGAVCSEAGRPLSNTVSATVAGPPPLTAEFVDVPESHDGQSLFAFELRFSEDFPGRLPFALLRDEAFRVEHGRVHDAARIEQRQNQRWTIQVQPDSHEAVTIELPATTDCSAARAVCSEAGRPLSNTVSATVAGPPPLTAEFVDLPESHDGESAFEFELRFSEDFPGRLAPALLREEAFEVENGTVQRARRAAPEQNQRWTIQVQPDSHADVTIELPAASDCSAAGAVCTEAGRPLSNAPSATIAGPRPAARVDGPVLTLAWPTPRDGFAAPGGKDFAVRVDGGLRPVASASLWRRGVVLELAEPVQPEQAVALDYLGSAMHPLRDTAGNAEGAWRDLPVVNMTEQGGDAPAILAADAILPPPADSLSASFAGQELGDANLAVATLDPGVRRLDLSGNALTDIAALAPLATLQSLDLSDNALVDLAPLRGLTALRRLDLGGNDIAALWPLAELPHLEVLLLDGNRVTALGALTHMTGLEHLDLAGNAVADLSPLADLSSLRRLDLGRNPARDLSPVGDLDRLVWLRLPDAGGDVPSYRLVRLRWLLAPDAPGQCLGCAALPTPETSAH